MRTRPRQSRFGRRKGFGKGQAFGPVRTRARFGYVFSLGLLAGVVVTALVGLGFASASSIAKTGGPSGVVAHSKQAFWQAAPRVTEARGWVIQNQARASAAEIPTVDADI